MLGKDLSELRRSESANRLSHWRLFALATLVIWLNTYVVQRFYFDLSISGWYQEWMMLINPLGSTMLMLGADGQASPRYWRRKLFLSAPNTGRTSRRGFGCLTL